MRQGKSNSDKWPHSFMDQSGANVDVSFNGMTKLLKMLSE